MNIRFPDGNVKEYPLGITPLEIASQISGKLAKSALAASVNGKTVDLKTPVTQDASLSILTFDDAEGKHALRHTASHVMAEAVKRLYPKAKLAIGPAIENGFYYDFDVDTPFTTQDLENIEKEMQKISDENKPLVRYELPRDQARDKMDKMGEPYKVELIDDLPEGEAISFYDQNGFVDLCAGPHAPSTGKVKYFKLLNVAGAYWRGSEKNKMLQRIYGTVFDKKESLDEYLFRMEEAKKRDHRKLGKELDLYSILDEGPGFPFFHPKGMIIRNELENFWRTEHAKNGYQEIRTPIILNRDLWIKSGHWDHYRENMYFTKIDENDYAVKPMNCPGGMLMFKRRMYSYRDLPLKLAELGLVHRHEVSGALHGLMRVRCFTQDDAHIFMTTDQIQEEILKVIELTQYFYDIFGFKYAVEVSTRPENSMGSDEDWEMATNALKEALQKKGMPFTINEGDGAFYGPKIDFHLQDSIGRTWQCGTIQLDFQMPERFDLNYIGEDGAKHRPVMIHRVVLGSVERFIAILTEHFAGAFPVWLAPVQVRVMALTDRAAMRAQEITEILKKSGIRAESDLRNEKIGFKIREAQQERIPYMLILGDKEVENGTISVRSRIKGDMGSMELSDFKSDLLQEIVRKLY
ncbi:MAG: threonine--tRNA ligase [Christensenellales bacterium]